MNLNFSQQTLLKEIMIRGRVMAFSAEIEFLLVKIILYSLLIPNSETVRVFVRMMMSVKLDRAIEDLNNYKPSLYLKYKDKFDELKELIEFRNHIAHCKMQWNEDSPNKFIMIDFEKIEGEKKQKITPVEYYIEEAEAKIESLRLSLLSFAGLHEEMNSELNEKYPEFFKNSIS